MELKDYHDILPIIAKIAFEKIIHISQDGSYIKANYKFFTGFYSFIIVFNQYSGLFKENILYRQMVSLYPIHFPKTFCKYDISPKLFYHDADVLFKYIIDNYPLYRESPNIEEHINIKCLKLLTYYEKTRKRFSLNHILRCEKPLTKIVSRFSKRQIKEMISWPIFDYERASCMVAAILNSPNMDPDCVMDLIKRYEIMLNTHLIFLIRVNINVPEDIRRDTMNRLYKYYVERNSLLAHNIRLLGFHKW
jgi:hypothetical protein